MLDSTFLRTAEAAAARFDVPALAFGTAGPDGLVEVEGVGCDPETRFRVASVTKPMTATLALRLLDLAAPTGVWPDDVRVHHLLSHTSGFDGESGDLSRFGDGDDALGALVAELPAIRRLVGVDEVWSYANTGYWLAGWLAAEAAGLPYEDALHETVLRPAGMGSSGFDAPDLPGSGPHATAQAYSRARRPSGGVVADVADLLRFGRAQLGDPATDELRRARTTTPYGTYGLGYFGQEVGGVEIWGHPGSAWGYQSSYLLVPARGAVFAGLTNSGNGAHALRELEELWLERVVGVRRPAPESVELPQSVLAGFSGTYGNEQTTVQVAPSGSGLSVEGSAGSEPFSVEARPIGATTFEVVGGDDAGDRFDFPRAGFARLGSRLLPRVS